MYLVKNGSMQFYCNDDKYEAMDALGYELYKVETIPVNDVAKKASSNEQSISISSGGITSK